MLFDVLIASLLLLYLVPMADAIDQAHPDALAISLLNIFLGWTCIGWIIALVWARTESPVDFYIASRRRNSSPRPAARLSNLWL